MALMEKKKKVEKVKLKIRWWKLKETSCQVFRQDVIRILGDKDGLPDEWDKTAEILRKIAETMLGVTLRKQKGDRKSIKEKKEVKKHGKSKR